MASLIGGLLRKHDRSYFRLVGLALKTAGDLHQKKMAAGKWREEYREFFDKFIDIAEVDDREASLRIQQEEVELLVDLNGGSVIVTSCRWSSAG